MRFLDEKTGETNQLFATVELSADLQAHSAKFDCFHTETEIRRRLVGGGAIQICRQCLRCGRAVGGAIKRSSAPENLASFEENLGDRFEAEKKAGFRATYLKHLDLQQSRGASHQREYDAYLASLAWAGKRQKVLKRADGICEGCGDRPAEQIHHLTYRHLFDEFLFELVAVCRTCHERLHEEGPKDETIDLGAENEPRCCACRWQDEKSGADWCGKFDVSQRVAMAERGQCGPKQSELEELKRLKIRAS